MASDWIRRCESVCNSTYGPPGNPRADLRCSAHRAWPLASASSRCFTAERSSHLSTASLRSRRNNPSPRFSTAGNQLGSSAMAARSTSESYSPWMSGVTASNRVKPARDSTSRRRWSWMTSAIPSTRPVRRQAPSGRRRAWKSGFTGTSSPNPSGAASSASSSISLTDLSLPAVAALQLVDWHREPRRRRTWRARRPPWACP